MPEYYTILPARVRYNKELSYGARLLYSDILALSNNDKGYCYATNEYFASAYDVTNATIVGWIKSLIDNNLIRRDIIYKSDSKEVEQRRLYVVDRDILSIKLTFKEEPQAEEVVEDSIYDVYSNLKSNKNNKYEAEKALSEVTEYIVKFLNNTAHTSFKYTTANTKKLIKARIKDGFSLQDFEKVILWKYNQWGKNPFKFSSGQLSSDYLRPSTLFSNNFESYLHEAINNINSESNVVSSVPVDEDRSGIIFV